MVSASDLNPSQKNQGKQSNPTFNLPSDRRVYQGSIQPRNFPSFPEDWTSEWETFPSSDGKLQLYSVIHHPQSWKGPRVLVILHGLGEHGGRYLHFAHYLKNDVDAIYCLDHRGHGRSEGLRGHVDSFDLYANDVALALSRLQEQLVKRFGKAEIHLLGHSMGGLIALRTLFLHSKTPLLSVCLSAPLLGIAVRVPWIKKIAAMGLSKIWGSVHMISEVVPKALSHDPDVVEAYITDRLVHNRVTPKFFTGLLDAMSDTVRRDSGIHIPLQMLIPLQDKVVDSNVSLEFFRALKSREKQLKTYPGFFHEPFNEVGKEEVFGDLKLWIKSHSSDSSI